MKYIMVIFLALGMAGCGNTITGIGKDITDVGEKVSKWQNETLRNWTDHSDLTVEICSQALSTLELNNSLFANMLRHIQTCASPGARYGYKSMTAAAEAVQLADRFNAKAYYKMGQL